MDKSINDIALQVERVARSIETRGGWRACGHGYDRQSLYQLGMSVAARRGLDRWGDRERKGRWEQSMFRQPQPQVPQQQPQPQVPQQQQQPQPQRQPLTPTEEERYEMLLTEGVNAQMMEKVLAWIAQDILTKREIWGYGDPYEIPKLLIIAMRKIIGNATQGTLF